MRGGCLCGAVRFDVAPKEMQSHACHCESCRRWSGSTFIAVAVGPDVAFEGAENIRAYASSDWAERASCGVCGSTLYYRVTAEGPGHGDTFLALGLFDEPDAFPLTLEMFTDRKPAGYAFAGKRKRMTKAEVEAQFGGAEG